MQPIYRTCQVRGCDRQACHECTRCAGIFCDEHGDYWPYFRIYPYDDWRCQICLAESYESLSGVGDTNVDDESPAPEYLATRTNASKGFRSDEEILEALDFPDEESAVTEYPVMAEDSLKDLSHLDLLDRLIAIWDPGTSAPAEEESPWETEQFVSHYSREAELEDDPDEPDYRDDVYFDGLEDFETESDFEDDEMEEYATPWKKDDS